ncbi:Bacterial ABC transporter protein EcsB [compost metagenome]
MRIAVLALLLVWWNRASYAGSGIYLLFLFLIGIQLSALRKLHSESFWLTVYPLPAGSKGDNTTQFIFRTQLVLVLVLGWPFLFTLGERPLPATGSLLAGALLAYFFKVYMKRKAVDPDDDF